MQETEKEKTTGTAAFQGATEISKAFLNKYTKRANPGSLKKAVLGVVLFGFGTIVTGLAGFRGPRQNWNLMYFILPGIFLIMTVVVALELGNHYRWKKDQNAYVLKWLEKEADDNVEIRFVLGYVYASGVLGVQDDQKAAEWYEKANGYPFADNELAILYAEGRGVNRDVHKALGLFKKASRNGAFMAKANMDVLNTL